MSHHGVTHESAGGSHFLSSSVYVSESGWAPAAAGEANRSSLWRVCSFIELTCRGAMNEDEEDMALPVSFMRLGCTVDDLNERAREWGRMERRQMRVDADRRHDEMLLLMDMSMLAGCVAGFQAAFCKLFGDPTLRLTVGDVQGLRIRNGSPDSAQHFSLTSMKAAVVVVIDENVVVSDRVAFKRSEVKVSEDVVDRWVMGQRVYRMRQGSWLDILPPFVLATFVFVFNEPTRADRRQPS